VAEDLGREHALLFVDGRPAPQGSKNAFVIGKRAVMVEASKHLPAWRNLDHYIRAVGDALTIGGLLADDALIVKIQAEKVWCGPDTKPEPGAKVEIWRL